MMIESVIIDTREPIHIQNLKFNDAPVMKMQLDTGDVVLNCADGNTLIIERKTSSDLLGSIADGRLFSQAARMKQASPWCYFVITEKIDDANFIDELHREWDYSAVQGALLTLQELGCGVIFCQGEDDFKPCLERLAKRSRNDVKVVPTRNAYVFSEKESVLASLPGIGSKKATEYLALFGDNLSTTIMTLCHADSAKDIPGWGEKSANKLKDFFEWGKVN